MKLKLTAADTEQLKLIQELDDVVAFEHLSPDEAYTISASAQAAFEDGSVDATKGNDWVNDYRDLRAAGWPWRVAVFIAWKASPTTDRWPKTQTELATEILGLRSDRVIRAWREKNPAIDEAIAVMQAAPLLKRRGDIFRALVESATTPDHKNHPDRKLALEMLGDYTPKSDIKLSGSAKDLSELSDSELDELAGGDPA